ncbi:hypothetical protein ACFSN5_01840 [Streptococcus tangpeifui]|uniref:hypothetical protein n=1 Tax=Streptococcus tangpeifui TaxID=2709400 RepID=UPI0032EEA2B6
MKELIIALFWLFSISTASKFSKKFGTKIAKITAFFVNISASALVIIYYLFSTTNKESL